MIVSLMFEKRFQTFDVAQEKGKECPMCISFKLPSTVDKSRGMAISFANNGASVEQPWQIVKGTTVTTAYDDCDNETSVVRFRGGWAEHDLLKNFLAYDHLLVLFFGKWLFWIPDLVVGAHTGTFPALFL